MAGGACRRRGRHVRAHQCEAGRAVVKFAVGPGGNRVAGSTRRCRGGESRSHVIGNVSAERGSLIPISQMAAHAVRRVQGVVVVDVARGAGRRRRRSVRAGQTEAGDAVIEGSGVPARRGVAVRAVGRGKGRSGGRVYRVVGLLPGGQVAARVAAVRRGNVQTIVVVDMAGSARNICVPVCQRESKGSVVEFSIRPFRDGVTLSTGCGGCRKTRGNVIGNAAAERGSLIPIGQMATDAVRRIQRVAIADVAGRARCRRRRHVCAGQSKASDAVIEGSGIPALGRVTVRAVGCGKGGTGGRVYGVVGLLPGGEVATRIAAIGRRDLQVVVIVDMAGGAGNVGVAIRQRKTSERVVEVRRIPAFGGVAVGAISRREDGAGCGVNRIVGLLPGGQVAAGVAAIGRSDLEVVVVVDVAGGAGHVGVAIRKRKTGGAVVELRIEPGVERVAGFASRGEVRGRVIGIRGLLKIAQVAGHAGRGQSLELADGCALVTLFTRHSGMSAEQRKPVLMVLDLLHGNLPAQYGVALRAVGTEFAPMNVRVAVRAILSHVGENRLGMALRTFHFFVHAA